jgi:hypothetical protein
MSLAQGNLSAVTYNSEPRLNALEYAELTGVQRFVSYSFGGG